MTPLSNSLVCQSLSKTFAGSGSPVLKDISLTIGENEFFTLLGPSGCGKTTLLRLIAGLEIPDSGSLHLGEKRIDNLPPFRRPINTVFQSYAIFPHLTVAQNIAFGLEARRMPRTEIERRVVAMLSLVRLDGMGERRSRQLSGGQQQRVALARALANQPRLLLLDEPLSALDLKLRGEMQSELKRIQSETGITFIFVTHDQNEALAMSNRIAVMSKGEILQLGSPQEIYETPANRFVAEFIGETNLLDAVFVGDGHCRLASGALVKTAGISSAGAVTVAVRPEHAGIADPQGASLAGIVRDVVYLGADRMYHVDIGTAAPFRVRETNGGGSIPTAKRGDHVGITFRPQCCAVLA